KAIKNEKDENALWVLENVLENALVAEKNRSPLCDDTGIPHLLLELGPNKAVTGTFLEEIREGVAEGLKELPGRPMAVLGDDIERIEQSKGMSAYSEDLVSPPMIIKKVAEDVLRLHIIMTGGGPEIRGKTYRVFHKHNVDNVTDEIVNWANEEMGNLGCTPSVLAVGIGRSHFEATAMMVEAMAYGDLSQQTEIEKKITNAVNLSKVGPLGLGGETSVLGTFLKVGPQRASGVRIVCLRPCCCFEPRKAFVEL
ncbi:MAG: fumarate hydratase, partial [Anaerovoracaceae bacterium]